MLEPAKLQDGEDEESLPVAPSMTHGALAEVDPWREPGAGVAAPGTGLGALWPRGLAQASETLEVIALAILMFLAVRAVGQNFIVDGLSMLPTFHDGELLIVNRLAYRTFDVSWLPGVDKEAWQPFGEPQAGDVVVFQFPGNPERDFIKRVIAVPGQVVEIREGVVYVDGEALEEPYVLAQPAYPYGPEEVPEGHVFVLGDNRNNSFDSHQWGMLDTSLIIGRADLRYWPFERIGLIQHTSPLPEEAAEVERPSSSAAPLGALTWP